jgi:hypothetical protein
MAFRTVLFALVPTLLLSPVAVAADPVPPLSPAQISLFESDHLASIDTPRQLEYRFVRAEPGTAPDYVDRVRLDLRPRSDGSKDIWVDFLSGAHHVTYPPLIGFRGNPALMYFLQHDVEEMRRQTGGSTTYFRNRIRRAFVDQAPLRAIELVHEGKPLQATEIVAYPFRGDPKLTRFPGMQEKRYRFVLAETVPGVLYAIEAEVPGETGQPPRSKQSLTFAEQRPCATDEGPCEASKRP